MFFGMLRDRKKLSWEGLGAVCRRCLVRGQGREIVSYLFICCCIYCYSLSEIKLKLTLLKISIDIRSNIIEV